MRQPPRGSGIRAAPDDVVAFRALAAALGLKNAETSYRYLEHGEPGEIEGRETFIHLPARQVLEAAEAQSRRQTEAVWQARVAAGHLAGSVPIGASWPSLSGARPGESGFRVSLLHASDRKGRPLPPSQTCQIWRSPWTALVPDPSADLKEVLLASGLSGRYALTSSVPSAPAGLTLVVRDTAAGGELWRGKTEAFTVVSVSAADERLHVVTRGRRSLTLLAISPGEGKATERPLPNGKSAAVHPAGSHAAIIEPRGETITLLDLAGGAAPVELGRRTLPNPSLPPVPVPSLSLPPGIATLYARQLDAVAPGERGLLLEEMLASLPAELRPAGRVENTQADVDRALEELRSKLAAAYVEPAPNYDGVGWSANGDWLFAASSAGMQVYPWRALLAAGSGDFPPATSHLRLPFEDHHHVPGAGLSHVHSFWHDPGRDRLFCGGDGGQIGFIDLATSRAALLPALPEPVTVSELIASTDGADLAAICRAAGRDEQEYRLVVWRLADLHARCDAL